ncbi:hypothetical protein RhiirA5_419614 [Rhizophagus irregularis]|uniref:Uncharacterized protein n=1 Tax=Rhizophagus irregularis TaxID=588596 RepID=A0A2N0PHZ4_9GLOM|nr:hypothetical protein RhiirA5_419614 [Rhizophagus irregularis]
MATHLCTKGYLTEIDITYEDVDDEMLIQAIYQNCPNLRYLKISLMNHTNSLISEFENLSIHSRSAPIGLFKFKFHSTRFELEDFKLFFDNWKNRNPVLLTISYTPFFVNLSEHHQLVDLFEKYKVKEIIKKYYISGHFEEFSNNY